MSHFFPQYLVKSIADRVRLGLGQTFAQFRQDVMAPVRQDPTVPVKCGNIELWEHRAVGT